MSGELCGKEETVPHVAQAGLELTPVSTSQMLEIYHHTQLQLVQFQFNFSLI